MNVATWWISGVTTPGETFKSNVGSCVAELCEISRSVVSQQHDQAPFTHYLFMMQDLPLLISLTMTNCKFSRISLLWSGKCTMPKCGERTQIWDEFNKSVFRFCFTDVVMMFSHNHPPRNTKCFVKTNQQSWKQLQTGFKRQLTGR